MDHLFSLLGVIIETEQVQLDSLQRERISKESAGFDAGEAERLISFHRGRLSMASMVLSELNQEMEREQARERGRSLLARLFGA